MSKYVLVNRRAGKFTPEEKIASRAAVAAALGVLGDVEVLDDHAPDDELARRVVVLEMSDAEAGAFRRNLTPESDVFLEPLIRRQLVRRRPVELQGAILASPLAAAANYSVVIRGNGAPLAGIEIYFYLQDAAGQRRLVKATTDAAGAAAIAVPQGQHVSFVEPIPYAGYWIMLVEAPPSGSAIDCIPIANASPNGAWWHEVLGVDPQSAAPKGRGIRVGVIDTGCGPHRNLAHVNLAGVFHNGGSAPPAQAVDVAEHGTHTTGIVGARPTAAGDYAGLATEAELFHVRVFASEDDGPSQGDIIRAIDCLSRDNRCDLINLSLGGGPPSEAEEDAIRDASERGTVCICSTGNSAGPVLYPAAYPECVAVGAIGRLGWAPPSTFSAGNRPHDPAKLGRDNLFLATFSCFGPQVACVGPGVGIVSTVPDHGGQTGLYMEMDGTSMASPAVAGALAVILSRDAAFATLPRDISRYKQAKLLLSQHCRSIGLAAQYEGRGLPVA